MSTTRVAINGSGRIGRMFFALAQEREELEIVGINDLAEADEVAYLLNYDSAYGRRPFHVEVNEDGTALLCNGREIRYIQEKDPSKLPWGELGVDVVIESTGFFTTFEKASAHKEAGAKRVIISAPAKDEPVEGEHGTVLMGVNEELVKTCSVSSNASCTTNAIGAMVSILNDSIGIEKALLNTTHAYTASQALVDSFNKKDKRLGRAAAENIVPTSTGAATATTKVVTDLSGKFDGIALRVPVVAGSIADVTFLASRDTSVEEVNGILKQAAGEERWSKVFAVTEESLVSSDIKGTRYGSIADLSFTRVVDGNLVKVMAWYDNETGYTHTLVEHAIEAGKSLAQ